MTCTVLYIVMSTSSTSWHLNMLVQNFPLGFRAICKTYKKMIEHDSFRFQNQFCKRNESCSIIFLYVLQMALNPRGKFCTSMFRCQLVDEVLVTIYSTVQVIAMQGKHL